MGLIFGSHFWVSFFIGAFVLLVALIFGTLQGHYRSRRSVHVGDELVRNRYKRNQG
jgi:ABC-type spermidine/putrescine transport system permease subunit II